MAITLIRFSKKLVKVEVSKIRNLDDNRVRSNIRQECNGGLLSDVKDFDRFWDAR